MEDNIQEVIEQTPETVEENIGDTQEVDTEVAVEDEEFNPEDMFEDDNSTYQFGQYDLSKYKDVFDFDNEEFVSEFNRYAKEYASKGFTQEQIEYLLDSRIAEAEQDPKQKQTSSKEIKERLNKGLSNEEKRNYKAINSFVVNALAGTELEGQEKAIVSNPALVKLMNVLYKKSLGSTTNIKGTQRSVEKQIRSISLEDAQQELLTTIAKKGDKEKVAKELYSRVSDRESFKALLNATGIKIK